MVRRCACRTCCAALMFASAARAEDRANEAPSEAAPEVRVEGKRSEAERRRRSSDAVVVVETHRAKQESADLGEVLARTQGVSVRRSSGLGSSTGLSLNGFQDDQIRFFLDGIPLERSGYPNGIANVPVNLVERVEVYRGVVPIRLGADALGGAVNLVSEQRYDTRLVGSYQVGSFGTYRGTVAGRYRTEGGFVMGASAYADAARNDYLVDVDVTNSRGRLVPARVRRFHDGYEARGARAEVGIVDRSWAKKLVLEGFFSTFEKELQHNVVMTVPYGEVTYGEKVGGGTARWEVDLSRDVGLELVANYSHRVLSFIDDSSWVYDWFGRRVRERRVPGEIIDRPTKQRLEEDSGFARGLLGWKIGSGHALRVSVTPSLSSRTGEDRTLEAGALDPLRGARSLFTTVTGVEYQVDAWGDRVENVVFMKDYVYAARGRELEQGRNAYVSRARDEHALGGGDALRVRFARWGYAKASYEYATRMPRVDELFGNGAFVLPNLSLDPERSHNANLGPRVEWKGTDAGSFSAEGNLFFRESSRLIVLLGAQTGFRHENIAGARGIGLEGTGGWTAPGRWLSVEGTITWQDIRNVSSEGTFGAYDGDRIPNRPHLFGSWKVRGQIRKVGFAASSLEPYYYGRCVAPFYRAWESAGMRAYKQTVDTQITHDVGVAWVVDEPASRITSSLELDNVTNARVYDYFGAQRPGRAVFLKVAMEL